MGREYIREVMVVGNIPSMGDVVYFDDFEGTFQWAGSGDTGYTLEQSTTKVFRGTYAMHFQTPTASPNWGGSVHAERYVNMPVSQKISVEFFVLFPTFIDVNVWVHQLYWYDGSINHNPIFSYDPSVPQWYYYDTTGSAVAITDGDFDIYPDVWHRIKFTVDFSIDKYVSLQVNHKVFDLSGIAFKTSSDSRATYFHPRISLGAKSTGYADMYIDDYLIRAE